MNRQERAERWVRAGPVKMARRLVELEDMIIEGMYEQLEKAADEAFKTMFQTGPAQPEDDSAKFECSACGSRSNERRSYMDRPFNLGGDEPT